MPLVPYLREHPAPNEAEIREAISGNLCRCTGYANIVKAIQLVVERTGRREDGETRREYTARGYGDGVRRGRQ